MKIAVVIPAYKVADHILSVLSEIGPEVSTVIVVDDDCPQNSGDLVRETSQDSRVTVIEHQTNQGVGGATMSGYKEALRLGADIVVKLDGDGQMDPKQISNLVKPIISGKADYTKGNRFYNLASLRSMPGIRVLGNGGLSLLTKLSSGYWDITDPTNGFTAIHKSALSHLPFNLINRGYFFESDLLFRLNLLRAVVWDVPMDARYGSEKSNLSVIRALIQFPFHHFVNFHKRLFYNYYLRDMSAASIELPVGFIMGLFGAVFGAVSFSRSIESGVAATAGTVMFSAVPLILGLQLILSFLSHDVASVPRNPRQVLE